MVRIERMGCDRRNFHDKNDDNILDKTGSDISAMSYAEPPPPIISDASGVTYATGSALGKGGFAICHRAERYDGSKPTGQMVALKIVKSIITPAKLAQKIHSKLSHPNIVAFYRAFSLSASTYVVLELCSNGSLADMIKKRKQLTLPEIRRFVIQICGAAKYLHSKHIIHRDLKTGNLFLDDQMNVKVGDFGLAALLVTEKEMDAKRRTTMCGTPNYLAPEILEKSKGHDEKADLWSIGAIIFTLAVGKAPFHASTKEEIYKKATQGKYAWPELSSSSAQSQDLRDLVSNLLVSEEMRLRPDQIVSHSFFKIPYIPTRIPSSAKEREPQWPEPALPSAEIIRRGYTDTWFTLCKQSGVGELPDGKCFVAGGSKKSRSVVADIHREAQDGLAPVMPIPKDVVYLSPVNIWDSSAINNSSGDDQALSSNRRMREIHHNEVATTRTRIDSNAAKDTGTMLPPPKPTARPDRIGTVRRTARTISEESARSAESAKPAQDEPVENLRLNKIRRAPGLASAISKENNSSSSENRIATSDAGAMKPQRASTVKRSVDASLARRPTTKPKDRPMSPDTLGRPATLEELKQVSPIKRTRRNPAATEVVEILSDPDSEEKPTQAVLNLPPAPRMARKLPTPGAMNSDSHAVPQTDPETVLRRLSTFRDNLAAALDSSQSRPPQSDITSTDELPFVSRWVDYSRKHGVGYVMSDGTVGCIINASTKNNTSVTHVLVRNGHHWLSRIGSDFANLDQVPIEIFEDADSLGIAKKVYKGLGSVKEGPLAIEAERKRTLSVLWVKFGRYMSRSLDGDEANLTKADNNFVRFYQRLGTVGIWAFADGSVQVHFPDHTKIVLAQNATQVAMTCISTEAVAYLCSNPDLLPHHVSSREVFADSTTGLLHGGGRVRARIIKANQLGNKLKFILGVVGQWTRNGGLGRMDPLGSDIAAWKGLAVSATEGEKQQPVHHVTVGRYGGDDRG
nr:serine/threonine-protein kinase plo1 [Quercus suber]